jgi:ribosome-binding factor A
MSRRIEQVNELIMGELAGMISRDIELENGLITVTYVKTSADLKSARVGISVLPASLSGTALKLLRRAAGAFSGELRKKLDLKAIPRFNYEIDPGEQRRSEIIDVLDSLDR